MSNKTIVGTVSVSNQIKFTSVPGISHGVPEVPNNGLRYLRAYDKWIEYIEPDVIEAYDQLTDVGLGDGRLAAGKGFFVKSLRAGANITIENRSQDIVITASAIKGDDGAKGDPGPQGEQGEKGADGADGVAGDHSDLSNVLADQHHSRSHTHNGSDLSGVVRHSDLIDRAVFGAHEAVYVDFNNQGSNVAADNVQAAILELSENGVDAHIADKGNPHEVKHDQLTDLTENQHHNKLHSHNGIDGSGSVAHSSLSGLTPDNHHSEYHDHEDNGIVNGLQAVLSLIAPVDVFTYDTSKDSDGGAWRDRTQNLSWYNEPLNTATRGKTRKFPAVVAIVAETNKVTIFDLTDTSAPMWMVFTRKSYSLGIVWATYLARSASMLNGKLVIACSDAGGTDGGLCTVDFVGDRGFSHRVTGGLNGWYKGNIAQRYDALDFDGTDINIVNNICNDVAMTIIDNAPIDTAAGIAVPTIKVETDNGTSIIDGTSGVGTVVDASTGVLLSGTIDNDMWSVKDASGDVEHWNSIPTVDSVAADKTYTNAIYPQLLGVATNMTGKTKKYFGSSLGLTILDAGTESVTHITDSYNTGIQKGDIRLATLADTVAGDLVGGTIEDRCVKDNILNVVGTIARAGNGELVSYSGFSATDYIEQPYTADLDFGTGDFCVMGWASSVGTGVKYLLYRRKGDNSGELIEVYLSLGVVSFRVSGSVNSTVTGSILVNDGNNYFIVAKRVSGVLYLFINAVSEGSIANTSDLIANDQILTLGNNGAHTGAASNTLISLLRISATAPTDQEILDIYNDEKPLFAENAKCTLQGTSTDVKALDYNEDLGKLLVGTSSGGTRFKGLVAEPEPICVKDSITGDVVCTEDSNYTAVSTVSGFSVYGTSTGSVVNSEDISVLDTFYSVGAALSQKADIAYADEKLKWLGQWVAGTYEINDVVTNDGYLSVANTQTTDIPSPSPVGLQEYLYAGTTPTTPTVAKQVISGIRYTPSKNVTVSGYRIRTVIGNSYKISSVVDPLGTPIFKFILEFTATKTGWVEASIDPQIMVAGRVLDLVVITAEPDPTPTEFSGDWSYSTPKKATIPLSGQITHADDLKGQLQIHKTDADTGDRSAELAGISSGDIIKVSGLEWAVQATSDLGDYVSFTIAPALQTSDGVLTFTFETVTATPITHMADPTYWASSGGEMQGLFSTDSYQNATFSTDAFGADILVQEIEMSDEWDIMSTSSSGAASVGPHAGFTYDYVKGAGYTTTSDAYTSVADLLTGDRVEGLYQFSMAWAWNMDTIQRSAKFRYRITQTAGVSPWTEMIQETKDVTNEISRFYAFPKLMQAGTLRLEFEASVEGSGDTLNIPFCDLVIERKV